MANVNLTPHYILKNAGKQGSSKFLLPTASGAALGIVGSIF